MSVDLNSKEIKKNSKGSSATKPVYLVDGSGYIFRAYYALPSLTRKSDGCPTGAVYGFCNMLQKLLSDIERAGGSLIHQEKHFGIKFILIIKHIDPHLLKI